MIKKVFKMIFLIIITFIVGIAVGRCSAPTTDNNTSAVKRPVRYDDGQYISSNIGEIYELENLPSYNEDGQIGTYYDSQGEGYYLFNEEIEFNILESPNSYPATYYFTFENDVDEPYNDIYIYIEWDMDYGCIYIDTTEQLGNGLYTLSFQVDSEYRQNYDRYFVYNIMLNEGNYTEYEPLDKTYGTNYDLGMFKFAALKWAYFDGDTPKTQTIKPLDYDIISSGFISKNWELSEDRPDYGIIADFGANGFNINKYGSINILNGTKDDYRAYLDFGQQIYLFFKNYVYSVNGADLSTTLSYIDLNVLKQQHGAVLYKIYFVGYGQDYLPGGLSTNNDYTLGFDNGYDAGDSEGFHRGYGAGYDAGEDAGYDKGYIEGKTEGLQQSQGALGIVKSVLSFITLFTAIEILPGIKIIYLLGLVVMVSVFKWIMGLFGGGN